MTMAPKTHNPLLNQRRRVTSNKAGWNATSFLASPYQAFLF